MASSCFASDCNFTYHLTQKRSRLLRPGYIILPEVGTVRKGMSCLATSHGSVCTQAVTYIISHTCRQSGATVGGRCIRGVLGKAGEFPLNAGPGRIPSAPGSFSRGFGRMRSIITCALTRQCKTSLHVHTPVGTLHVTHGLHASGTQQNFCRDLNTVHNLPKDSFQKIALLPIQALR